MKNDDPTDRAQRLRETYTAVSRARFETWAKRTGLVPVGDRAIVGTGYPHSATVIAWAAWQAAQVDVVSRRPAMTDERIIEIRDSLLGGQGEQFSMIAFARHILADEVKP